MNENVETRFFRCFWIRFYHKVMWHIMVSMLLMEMHLFSRFYCDCCCFFLTKQNWENFMRVTSLSFQILRLSIIFLCISFFSSSLLLIPICIHFSYSLNPHFMLMSHFRASFENEFIKSWDWVYWCKNIRHQLILNPLNCSACK